MTLKTIPPDSPKIFVGLDRISDPAVRDAFTTLTRVVQELKNALYSVVNNNASSPLTVPDGGTGLNTLTAHALYVGAGASAPNALAVGTTHGILHANTGADPSWSAIDLASADVTGNLPIANQTASRKWSEL